MIKVTAIQTGTVQIKAAQATGEPGRSALGRKIDIFRDLKWLPPLPILAFLECEVRTLCPLSASSQSWPFGTVHPSSNHWAATRGTKR